MLTLAILSSTAGRAAAVSKSVLLGISPLTSFILVISILVISIMSVILVIFNNISNIRYL